MSDSQRHRSKRHWLSPGASLRPLVTVVLASSFALVTTSVFAQSWSWPWETQSEREPSRQYRAPAPRYQPRSNDRRSRRSDGDICLRLERQLANVVNGDRNRGASRDQLARQIRSLGQRVRRREAGLERRQCWDEFFFQRTLRNTRTCVSQYRALEDERRQLQDARNRYEQTNASNAQALQRDLINELARNRCGPAYQQQARRQERNDNPFASFFQQDRGNYDGGRNNTYRGLEFATYRTLCVRLCDGYYFPVSFSTLPNYFDRDVEVCQSRCAAPVALYYHQNPGGSIDQMVSVSDNSAYKQLETAFRYRKQFVDGCSCKVSEYVPEGVSVDQRPQTSGAAPRKFSPVR
ncbi:MAG: DUF2865 domain-containing protein [Pseudomonadota bacterium]